AARRDEPAPHRVIGSGSDRHVEAEPIDHAAVLPLEEIRDFLVGPLDRVHLQHVVRDERCHAGPVALRGLLVQAVAGLTPAVRFEHPDVRAGGGVERDLLTHQRLRPLDLVAVLAGHGERGGCERDVRPLAPGLPEPRLDVRAYGLVDVLHRMERMDVEAVGELAREPGDVGVDARDVDRDVRPLDRRRAEERGHEAELVVLAFEAGPDVVLPDVPDVTDQLDHLAESGAGRRPRRRVASLVVPLHLRPEAEDEAAARQHLEVPRDLRVHERAPRERDGDVRADRHVIGRGRGEHAWQVGIVSRFRGPQAVVAELLRVRRVSRDVTQVGRHEAAVDLHPVPLLEARRRGQACGDALTRRRRNDTQRPHAIRPRRRRDRSAGALRDTGARGIRRRDVAAGRDARERRSTDGRARPRSGRRAGRGGSALQHVDGRARRRAGAGWRRHARPPGPVHVLGHGDGRSGRRGAHRLPHRRTPRAVTRRTQRRRGPRGAWLLAVLVARGALATTVTIVNLDGGGEGLNDPTVVAPVGGNPATTRGAQRLRALQEAADRWAAALRSGVEIRVGASFDTDLSCTASSATFGFTVRGPPIANFPGAPLADTWYAPALANRIAGTDLNPGADDIRTKFNALVDGGCAFARTWYYVLDGNPGPTEVDFVSVALHELAHGLGFSSLVDLDTGQKSAGFDDAFSRHLGDQATGKLFPDMTDAERAAASVDTGNLEWVGAATDAASVTLTQGR